MINVNSNIDDFIKRFTDKSKKITKKIEDISEVIASKMIDEMSNYIIAEKSTWLAEKNSIMESVNGTDFTIKKTGTGCVVSIGDLTSKITTKDGTMVNPYFFIEFGYGIRGQKNPKQNANEYSWEYNVNNHTKSWYYWAYGEKDSEKIWTVGKEGINFMYNTIQKFRTKWKEIVMREIKEVL